MTDAVGRHGQPAGRARRTAETVTGIQGRDGAIKVTLTGQATEGRPDVSGGFPGRTPVAEAGYFAPLAKARYLLLTTFKPKGTPMSGAVPGIVEDGRAYFRVRSRSGAARRLQHTDGVQVAPCGARGLLSYGPPLDAGARRLGGEEAGRVAGQLARKYPVRRGFPARLLRRARHRRLAHYELFL